MPGLIQLVYASAASRAFSRSELTDLLIRARENNARQHITGALLYAGHSFFQVLEGEVDVVDALFAKISADDRHRDITLIVREPIKGRSFGDWTMGYGEYSPHDTRAMLAGDLPADGLVSWSDLGPGRARKLLSAFKEGRWRARISSSATPISLVPTSPANHGDGHGRPSGDVTPWGDRASRLGYTFAFQPIIHAGHGVIFSHEALIRGLGGESAAEVLAGIDPEIRHQFDERSRLASLACAASLGLKTRLNLNFLPGSLEKSETAITSLLDEAAQWKIRPEQFVLEVLESEIIRDIRRFSVSIRQYRESGILFAIDDFGAGYAGLSLLAEFQPDLLKLDMHLVRGIESRGPRQAIVRGILRTCFDLGIDVIAEGVETREEYHWLLHEGVSLFQGNLMAPPALERLYEDASSSAFPKPDLGRDP